MVAIWRDSRGEYGAPRIKMRLAAKGMTASRRRIRRVMAAEGLVSSYARLYTDRGGEFASAAIDEMLEVFGIERSLSRKGCPYDNAVIESCNKTLKATLIYRNAYGSLDQLRRSLNAWVWWYNNERIHSTLGYMSPVEFRMAGLSL